MHSGMARAASSPHFALLRLGWFGIWGRDTFAVCLFVCFLFVWLLVCLFVCLFVHVLVMFGI